MGGSSSTITTSATRINALQVQSSASGKPIAWIAGRNRISPNLIYYTDFEAVAKTTKKKSGGKGGGGATQKDTTYTYYAALILAIGRGTLGAVHRIFRDKEVFTEKVINGVTQSALAQAGFSFARGDRDQPVWGFLQTKHPAEAIAYADTAYVYAGRYLLNDSAGVQNHTFEVDGPYQVPGLPDANPGEFLPGLLLDPLDGIGFNPWWVADLSNYRNYCLAENLLLSPVLDEQSPASEAIARWLQLTNSELVWSAGQLKVIPYGDQVVTGNGVTWYPDVTPVADLTDDDFLAEEGEPPVSLKIKSQADSYNEVSLEILDRAHEYNTDVVRGTDQAAIEQFGSRPMETIKAYEICEVAIGAHAAQLLVQRKLYVRNEYQFSLGWQHVLLEPMDLVTITEPGLNLQQRLVRLISVEEDEEGKLAVVAEDALLGVGSAPNYPVQSKSGFQSNQNAAPGPVLAPIMFNPPESLLLAGELQVWGAVAGASPNWGGCEIWISADGDSFRMVETIYGRARMGQLSAALADGNDPDTVNTLSVQLAAPDELAAATTAEADSGATLCWVDGELLSYRDATLTGVGAYQLGYLRRGRLSSAVASHPSGAPFVRLDDAVWKYSYARDQIGRTVWVKFRSFNVYGRALEDLADVTAYSVTLSPARVVPASAQSLALVGSFEAPYFTVSWTAGARAEDRLVRIRNAGSNALLRQVSTTSTAFTYQRADALVDGALLRSYRVEIIERNAAGSAPLASVLVTNTAPEAVTGTAAAVSGTTAGVSCDASSAADAAGYMFVYSTVAGFDPTFAGTIGYQGASRSGEITGLIAGTTYFLCAAAYDTWSSTRSQLNFAPAITFNT
ncbi:phage tail protein [Pseudomonas sp. PDM30]|uniref:phage tail protein n=1 Tax=Pseudomonas sp. PDM30 TaxID=2854773 RepID=UPI001C475D91|nr:phage tail protein [Pseudomonas sp. PDM30]MBV7489853.1 phage tail protein [Pseudomonas sp. PDM30]